MGLWAVATIEIKEPKVFNIKDKLVKELSNKFGCLDEFVVTSKYYKEFGLVFEIRTKMVGKVFDDIIQYTHKYLKSNRCGDAFITIERNYYL